MSFPQFYVTYCIMNTDAGANPLGHACIILSKQETTTAPVSVVNCFGFYSQPSTTTDPFIKAIKHLLGLKMDLQDGHGILKQEKMHEIDGNGIQGRSFEITQDQFDNLQKKCTDEIEAEATAKEELDEKLKKQSRESNGYTRFMEEKALAALEKRPPRLHPFHVKMEMTLFGLNSSFSHTCKTRALNLLREADIIDDTVKKQLEGGLAAYAFPRFSGETLPPIRLVSTGHPARIESRKSGRVFYNRAWGEKNALFFASPLNVYKAGSTQSPVYDSVNMVLTHTRHVENRLHAAIEQTTNEDRKANLKTQLHRIQSLYDEFNNTYKNNLPDYLSAKRVHAENYLNIATLSLSPERVNYSFALRALESLSIRCAILGFIGILLSAALFSGAIAVTLFIGAALYTTYNLYEFNKEETKFAEMKQDYLHFTRQKSEPDTRENTLVQA